MGIGHPSLVITINFRVLVSSRGVEEAKPTDVDHPLASYDMTRRESAAIRAVIIVTRWASTKNIVARGLLGAGTILMKVLVWGSPCCARLIIIVD